MDQRLAYEAKLIAQLLDTLREVPDVHAELGGAPTTAFTGDRGYDAQIEVRVAGKSISLLVEIKKEVYPRDVRQMLWQLREISQDRRQGSGSKAFPLLVAESISPGAKELLRAERVGYYEAGGSLSLPVTGAYLYIDKPPSKAQEKSLGTMFSGRRTQLLHTLLVQYPNWFGVTDIAKLAVVSPATASQVLTELDRLDWVISRGQGPGKQRQLREPAALLDAWVKHLVVTGPPDLRRYYVPGMKVDLLLETLDTVFSARQVEYAISYEAAAQRYAPFLSSISQVRCRSLVGPNTEAAIGDLGARVVSEGANLVLIETKRASELLFREKLGGIWLASPIQVYLDLMRGEGRAKEMAEHLRRERIGF